MDLAVSMEHHFDRTPDGAIWTKSMFTNGYWQQYLDIFDHVRVVARVRDTSAAAADWQRVDGQGVALAAVPDYLGPLQYIQRAAQVQQATRAAIRPNDAVLLYNGQLAACIEPLLRRTGHPYGMYVISDPQDVFAAGATTYPLRSFFRWWFTRQVQRQSVHACAVAYVSKIRLQQKYPPATGAFSSYFAMQGLPDEWFTRAPRPLRPASKAFDIITVGSLAQLYKAPDVLIDAVDTCVQAGLDLTLTLIGDGKHRPELEARAEALGLSSRVHFLGQLPSGPAIRAELDKADLFVLPSRAEALGLAVVEAMARGLPCIGSTVGGIPELLSAENLVLPANVQALACKMREVLTDPARMAHMSAHNLEKAREYDVNAVGKRQNEFYRHLREKTGAWQRDRSR